MLSSGYDDNPVASNNPHKILEICDRGWRELPYRESYKGAARHRFDFWDSRDISSILRHFEGISRDGKKNGDPWIT